MSSDAGAESQNAPRPTRAIHIGTKRRRERFPYIPDHQPLTVAALLGKLQNKFKVWILNSNTGRLFYLFQTYCEIRELGRS